MFVNNIFGIINKQRIQVNDVNEHQEKNEQGRIVQRITNNSYLIFAGDCRLVFKNVLYRSEEI